MRLRYADRGSALLLVLISATVIVTFAIAALGVVDVAVQRQHLGHSADAAAHAAAAAFDADPCPVAERVALLNGAIVTSCVVDGDDVVVTVVAPGPSLLHRIAAGIGQRVPPITATSRAGPG